MAKHGPKVEISHEELAKISSFVLQYLEATQSYDTEGLLRIAPPEKAILKLIKDLKKLKNKPADIKAQLEKQSIEKDPLNAHVYVGALKRGIRLSGNLALVSKNEAWEKMRKALKNTNPDFNETEQVKTSLDEFDLAIKDLYESSEPQDKNAAFVLYTLLHISTKIADREPENKMSVKNCAIVVGPSISELLAPPHASNALDMVKLMQNANTFTENLIASRRFAFPLEKKIQYMKMSREQLEGELNKNNFMIEQLNKQIKQETGKKGLEDSISRYNQMLKELFAENTLFSELINASPRSRSDSISEGSSSSGSSRAASSEPSEEEKTEKEIRSKEKYRMFEKKPSRIHLVNKNLKDKDINDPKGKEEERPDSVLQDKKKKKPK